MRILLIVNAAIFAVFFYYRSADTGDWFLCRVFLKKTAVPLSFLPKMNGGMANTEKMQYHRL
ncbi:MAG: hypothetical protein ACTTI3_07005 [Treponema sp.]